MKTGRYSVLLVEDDSVATDLARRAAAERCPEISLTVVAGGDAVLDWLNESVANKEQMPHIILMDLNLPKLDGLGVLRKLRLHAATRDIPIVAFSVEYTQADVQMSYRAGANSFVAKPADLEQFSGFFREQMAYWMQPRQRELAFASGQGAKGRS
ncbi:response regulator [Candidatus Ferrigenium straubiae]|uniref:response regulator n=1 Tax=Candidatus Ferrigenium straubiae TaxID=2919506 RepID=UPI003F4A8BF5